MHSFRKALPGLLFVLALISQALLAHAFPAARGLPDPFRWLALPVFILACGFPLGGLREFLRARTSVFAFSQPVFLVRSGVYRHTRNPMYLGMLLILVSLALWGNHWPLWLPIAGFIPAITRWVIRWEEATLVRTWPEEFTAWRNETARWLFFTK